MDMKPTASRSRGRSPSLAALLSFLWPGLGQLYIGKRRWAALFAVPPCWYCCSWRMGCVRGLWSSRRDFADPSFSLAAVVIVLLFGVWRLAAVAHAFAERRAAQDAPDFSTGWWWPRSPR